MGTIVSKIYDEIQLHGSYEAYCAHRDREDTSAAPEDTIPYFPDPEVVNPEMEVSMDFNHTFDVFHYALRAHLNYLRANETRYDQKGNINTRVGIT